MLCCTAQDFIAQLVAVLVVELLEVVNVHEHHRQRAVVTLGAFDFLGQLVLQRTPVVATGQAVGDGQVANFFQQFSSWAVRSSTRIVKVVDVLVQGRLQLDHALLQQVNLIAVGLGARFSRKGWSGGGGEFARKPGNGGQRFCSSCLSMKAISAQMLAVSAL